MKDMKGRIHPVTNLTIEDALINLERKNQLSGNTDTANSGWNNGKTKGKGLGGGSDAQSRKRNNRSKKSDKDNNIQNKLSVTAAADENDDNDSRASSEISYHDDTKSKSALRSKKENTVYDENNRYIMNRNQV